MDLEVNASAEEINRLQRCIHDLVALLALPAAWSGGEPSRILDILLDALLPMISLDFICGRVKDPAANTPVQIIRVASSCELKPHEIRGLLSDWFENDGQDSLPATRKRFGDKGISIFPVPIEIHGGTGMILAGSSREDFPGQTESLLLSVAAKQASIGLIEAWLLNEQKRTVNQLEMHVAERTEGLAKQAEDAQRATERNLAAIINTIPTTAWTTRPDGYCDFLNQVWLDYAGMSAEQAQGWGWAEAIHPDDREQLVEVWQSSLASGIPVDTEARIRRFDSSYRWFLIRANPLRDESGNILKWCGTCTEIEDHKRWEQILRARELSWRQIVDNIPGLVATTGALGEVEFLNRQTLEYFGKTSEELKNWALIGAVHPDDLPLVIEARKKSIEGGQIYEIEHRCRRADGIYRWFQVRGLPVRDVENKVTAWYLLLTDIDDRKQAEEALRASEQNLGLTINGIPTCIHVLRPDGSVLYANQTVLDLTGLTLEDARKEDYRARVFHPEDVERLREERREALARPVPFENEQRVLWKDGKYRWFLIRYNPLLDAQGKIERWYVAATDIDGRKRAEDAQARQAGVRADVSAAFSKPAHLAEVLRGCTEAIVRHLDAAFARIWMLNQDESILELQASAGMYTRLDGSYSRIPVGDLKVGLIAREKKAHFTNDVMNDPRVNDKRWTQDNGMVAFAGYPLVVEDRLIGVLALFARQPLSESILDTLASVADTIAQGIERKRADAALRNALDRIQKSEANLRQV